MRQTFVKSSQLQIDLSKRPQKLAFPPFVCYKPKKKEKKRSKKWGRERGGKKERGRGIITASDKSALAPDSRRACTMPVFQKKKEIDFQKKVFSRRGRKGGKEKKGEEGKRRKRRMGREGGERRREKIP